MRVTCAALEILEDDVNARDGTRNSSTALLSHVESTCRQHSSRVLEIGSAEDWELSSTGFLMAAVE
jgi:hypothetical protein